MSPRNVVLSSVVMLALVAPLMGCGLHGRPKVERKARPAGGPTSSVAVAAQLETDTVVAPGIVEPWGEQVDLSAQESGWIAQIAVKEGDIVRAGQTLARLEDGSQRRAVEVATADLAEVEATLEKVKRGATVEELDQAQAEYDAATARAQLARSEAQRAVRLREVGVVTDDAKERATAEAQAQTALAERAQARLAELKRGPRAEDRTVAHVRVEAARARFKLASENLERRRIAAPAGGTILLSRFHPGEYYDVRTGALVVLGDMTRLQVRLEVDEIDARAVETGAACPVFSDSGARLGDGTVVRLAPKMGRRGLALESPTAREDVRVREAFVEVPTGSGLIPGQRVWGHVARMGIVREDRVASSDSETSSREVQ